MNNITDYIKNIKAVRNSEFATTSTADGYEGGMEINEIDIRERITSALALDKDSEEYDSLADELAETCGRLHNGLIAALEAAATEIDWDMGEYCEACEYIADCLAAAKPVDDDRVFEILASEGKQIKR